MENIRIISRDKTLLKKGSITPKAEKNLEIPIPRKTEPFHYEPTLPGETLILCNPEDLIPAMPLIILNKKIQRLNDYKI